MQKHKVLAFLLSLIASIGLWVYAVTFVNPDDTATISDIRVRITGTSALAADGLMLTGGEVQYVDVEIAGRRSDLKELNSSTLEAIADVSNIDSAGSFEVSWTLNPPATVASGDISLVAASSNRITVKVSERRDREIPIAVEYTEGEMAQGYMRGETFTDVEFLSISGPAEEVNKIAKAVVTVDLTDANARIDEDMEYRLLDEDGQELTMSEYVTISAPTVHVTVQVLPYKDIALTVSLQNGGGLTSSDVKATILPNSIRVTGTEEALQAMEDSYAIQIDLASVEGVEDVTLSRSIELPQGVTRWGENATSLVTTEIQLEISDNVGILQVALGRTELRCTNGAQDMEYSFAEPDLIIEIRGRNDKLRELKNKLENNEVTIIVKADISELDPTTGLYPLTFELPRGYGVGMFEEYAVRLIETAVEPPEE